MKTSVIAFAAQKGGVGKTTTTTVVGHGLSLQGKSVVIVDFDPQGQVAVALGMKTSPGIFNTLIGRQQLNKVALATGRDNLVVIPGDKRTSTAQTVMYAEGQDVFQVVYDTFVQPLKGKVDYILFDTSPSVGGLQEAAIFNSDVVISPVATEHLALYGFMGTLETVKALKKRGWNGEVIALPTFYDERTSHSRETLALIKDQLSQVKIKVLDEIHDATDLKKATKAGQTIFEFDAKSRAAQEYAKIVWAIKGMKL